MADADTTFVCGVDTGGTFTDCVGIDSTGRLWTAKASSTPPRFETGFFAGLTALAAEVGLTLETLLARTTQLVHGTTVATNALLERRGSTVGLLATRGHRDAIFVMRGVGRVAGLSPEQAMRTLATSKPEPLVTKRNALEVVERIDWKGEVIVALDEEQARRTIAKIVEAGVEAIAVALLWAFRNPVHENRIGELIDELAPDVSVSLAHTLAPRMGEYERTVAAVIDAYVKPVTVSYLREVERGCREHGYRAPLLVVQCDGNVAPIETVLRAPVATLQSGPAAGLEASRLMGLKAGRSDVIVLDMGGTSCDVGLIVEGSPLRRTTNVVSQYEYFTPSIEIESIGVGGGSIASIDTVTGGLRVGPRSAGASPGPACYGRGGTEPTVTDADLVLGRLDPNTFLGGRMSVDRDAAYEAVARLAGQLGLEPERLAAGISRIAEVQMAEEIRKLTVAKGYDPRTFTVFAYGGAGPVHAGAIARELNLTTIVVPLGDVSSQWSAFGAATSELGATIDASVNLSEPFDRAQLADALATLGARAHTTLTGTEARDRAHLSYAAGMRYRAQVNEVWVALEPNNDPETLLRLVERFESQYEALFGEGTGYRAAGIEIAALRCVATIKRPFTLREAETLSTDAAPVEALEERLVYWEHLGGYHPTPVAQAGAFADGGQASGPLIVELANTTVVVYPGQYIRSDAFGNLVLETARSPTPTPRREERNGDTELAAGPGRTASEGGTR